MKKNILSLQQLLPTLGVAFVVCFALGYGLFEARRLITGPRISITTPRDGQTIGSTTVRIAGEAKNTAFFSINGKQAFVDQHEHFEKTLSPPPGYTVLSVSATDRFGRTSQKLVHITIVNYCLSNG